MAFNYENPHDDPNLGNYDYYVLEVKDFQRKLDEYQESVDQKLADQDSEIADFKLNVNNQIGTLRNQIEDFEERITNEVDSINEHTETYVNNYLTENITEILETNPVLETKYEKIGYIDTNETCTLELEEDKIYEIMTIDYALNMHKGLAVNNASRLTVSPFDNKEFVDSVSLSGEDLIVHTSYAIPADPHIGFSNSDNVLTVTNYGANRVRVYAKIIGEL